jgi:hypothetical protein
MIDGLPGHGKAKEEVGRSANRPCFRVLHGSVVPQLASGELIIDEITRAAGFKSVSEFQFKLIPLPAEDFC